MSGGDHNQGEGRHVSGFPTKCDQPGCYVWTEHTHFGESVTYTPVGQSSRLSEEGRAAYWRMQWESAIGALAYLIAEHAETVEELEHLRADRGEVSS